jgi:biopolymer transport protein ExbD
MKFPRNAKILRGHFDVAPFAAVFFLLLIFVMLGALVPTAGLPLQPPGADHLPGAGCPTVAIAVDAEGNLYFENQIVSERVLATSLRTVTNGVRLPLTLVIHADKRVSYETLVHLTLLARDCGITSTLLATLPAAEPVPGQP